MLIEDFQRPIRDKVLLILELLVGPYMCDVST